MSDRLAKVLAEGVRDRGADVVFGFPGGGPNLEVVGAVNEAGLRFVLTHSETPACIMAATYGVLVGRPAMAIATRGPGAACAVNGAAQATLDRFPLLVVTDCVPTANRDRFAHQRFDQQQLFAPVTKWSGRLAGTPGAADAVRAALDVAAHAPGRRRASRLRPDRHRDDRARTAEDGQFERRRSSRRRPLRFEMLPNRWPSSGSTPSRTPLRCSTRWNGWGAPC